MLLKTDSNRHMNVEVDSMKEQEKVRKVVDEAEEAFWAIIAKNYPEIKTGDLCFSVVGPWTLGNRDVVRIWLDTNKEEV